MKFHLLILIALIIESCADSTNHKTTFSIPEVMIKNNLSNQYLQTKWEMYKYNLHDSLLLRNTHKKVSFIECDLILSDRDSFRTTLFDNDTIKTIALVPSYRGNDTTDFWSGKKLFYYGASFKGDTVKYIPQGDNSYLVLENNIYEKKRDSILIKYIKEHPNNVNSWLIEYALSKDFIKR